MICEGPTISYAGPAAGAPETPGADRITAPTVMPGMWDSHTHLMGLAETPGYDADVIVVDGDPVADISLLADPTCVTHVWKAGKLVKPR